MEYVIGEILLCLLAVTVIASVFGWLLHSVLGQGKVNALMAARNREIDDLRGETETLGKARVEATAALQKSTSRNKEFEATLGAATLELNENKNAHEQAAGVLKQRLAELEPLTAVVAEKDLHLAVWQQRFLGVVGDKDKALAAAAARIADQQMSIDEGAAKNSMLSGLQAQLAAVSSVKDEKDILISGLHAQLAAAVADRETFQGQLHSGGSEKDGLISDLQTKLATVVSDRENLHNQLQAAGSEKESLLAGWETRHTTVVAEHGASLGMAHAKLAAAEDQHSLHAAKLYEMSTLLSQRDEQLKSFDQRMRGATAEKDTIIGKLRSMVSQIEPLRQELQQRDQAIDQMRKRMPAPVAVPVAVSNNPSAPLEEAQRQIYTLLAGSASMKTALEGKDAEIASLSSALTDVKATAARGAMLESQVVDVTGRHAAAQAELGDLSTHHTDLEARLRQEASGREALERALEAKQEELDKARAELASLDTRTMTALDQWKARVDELEKALDGTVMIQNQVVDLSGRHAAAKAELGDLSTHHEHLETRMRQVESVHEATVRSVTLKDVELDKARAELASLDTRTMTALDRLKARVAELEKALDDDVASDAKLRSTIAADAAEMAGLRAQIELRDEQLGGTAMVQNQVVDLSGRHAAAKAEFADLSTHHADLEARLRQVESEHQATVRSLASKEVELDKARAELASLDIRTMSALDQLKARTAELEKAIDAEVTNEAALRATIAADSAEMAELRSQIALRDEQLANTSMLQNQVVDLTGRHAAAQADLDAALGNLSLVEARMREQSSEHGAAERSVEAKQVELDKSRAEVVELDSLLQAAPSTGILDERAVMLEHHLIDVTGRHAAAKSELDEWSTRFAQLEAHARQQGAEQEADARTINAKQTELDKARAEVASLDAKLVNIPALENELTELRTQIVDRDERLDAWDSRFHASVGELRGEIGALQGELHKLRQAPAAMAGAVGSGSGGVSLTPSVSRAAQRAEDSNALKAILEDLSLHGVQFLPSSAELIPQSLPVLLQASNAMHQYPDASVEIAGHTDSWGMPPDNLKLSQRRANAVKEYLINSGIAPWRLVDIGYGDTRPIDLNDTPDGRFANRRIEFHVKQ